MDIEARRAQIVEVAMRRFAHDGYRATRVEDIAKEVGVAKGTVFLHFGSKEGLFLAAYERAVGLIPAWLEAPPEIVEQGFWATLRYWLENAEESAESNWVPNRVAMIGRYDSGMTLRRPIERFMRREDPYRTLEFVEFGVSRGEIRTDVDIDMTTSMLEWVVERFMDILESEDMDPGLVRRRPPEPERRGKRIGEFIEILRSGIGSN